MAIQRSICSSEAGVSFPRPAFVLLIGVIMPRGPIFRRRYLIMALITAVVIAGGVAAWQGAGPLRFSRFGREVRFSRDIRPILNQNCVPCHGGVRQKNGVSFIFREEALG